MKGEKNGDVVMSAKFRRPLYVKVCLIDDVDFDICHQIVISSRMNECLLILILLRKG